MPCTVKLNARSQVIEPLAVGFFEWKLLLLPACITISSSVLQKTLYLVLYYIQFLLYLVLLYKHRWKRTYLHMWKLHVHSLLRPHGNKLRLCAAKVKCFVIRLARTSHDCLKIRNFSSRVVKYWTLSWNTRGKIHFISLHGHAMSSINFFWQDGLEVHPSVLALSWSRFCQTDRFHGNSNHRNSRKLCIFFSKASKFKI